MRGKTTGTTSYPWQSSSTTIRSTPLPNNCKGTSRVMLSHHWGSVLLVAHWQSCTRSHSSCLLLVCVMRCDAFYSIIRTLWLLIHVLMWWCVWSSSIEVYILASCRRSTSLESQLSFRDSYLAWGVIAFEWSPNSTIVVTYWLAQYLGQYWSPWDVTGIDQKVFLRAYWCHWDCENSQRIGGDMAEWSLWHIVWV